MTQLAKVYPEVGAGGFTRTDGTVEFYTRVNALLQPNMVVLDIGAGRGAQLLETASPYRTSLVRIQGKVKRLVGVDVDDAVLENRFLDEAHVIDGRGPLPFPDATFDLVFADWVLEHVATPKIFAAEVHRIVKPGGWFCARTPNRWGVTGIGTNLIPNRLHASMLKTLQPARAERDVFPTTYHLNSKARLRRYFSRSDWEDFSYFHNSTPPYVERSRLLTRLALLYFRLAPNALATNLHAFLRKR